MHQFTSKLIAIKRFLVSFNTIIEHVTIMYSLQTMTQFWPELTVS